MVPVLTQTPPTIDLVSMMHTLWPSLAAMIAAFWPPGPEPMTARSKSYVCSIAQACQRIDTSARVGLSLSASPALELAAQDWPERRRKAWIATCRSVVCHISGMDAFRKAP